MLKSDKKLNKALTILAALFIVIIIFSSAFFLVFVDRDFYDNSFGKYGTYEELGVDGPRLITDNLINYLTNENTEINETAALSVFTEKEKAHLEDVQLRIVILKYLSLVSVIALIGIVFWLWREKDFMGYFKRMCLYGAGGSFALLLILFMISFRFTGAFQSLHSLLFPAGNYLFPKDALLITMFPQSFFADYLKKMLYHALILTIITLFLGTSFAFTKHHARNKKK